MSDGLDRREFLRRVLMLGAAGAALELSGCGSHPTGAPAAGPSNTPGPAVPEPTLVPARATDAPQRATVTSQPAGAAVQPTTIAARATEAATPIPTTAAAPAAAAVLAVARGPKADPGEITRRAIAAIGGIERFVKKGADVIVKPNICSASYGYEYAATTNPEVVATIVALCLGAGAKRVRVMDLPFSGSAQAAYAKSGIAKAVGEAGGTMEMMSRVKYKDTPIPQGKAIKNWSIYQDVLQADVLINVPIAKQHSLAGFTLGLKNLMGVVDGGNRGALHANIHQRLADLATVIRPTFTVIDAIRILTANGPTGGNLDDVQKLDTIIASADPVAADAYGCTLFKGGHVVGYVKTAAAMGLGEPDLKKLKIAEITL